MFRGNSLEDSVLLGLRLVPCLDAVGIAPVASSQCDPAAFGAECFVVNVTSFAGLHGHLLSFHLVLAVAFAFPKPAASE